jgi:hypothetical protein
MEEKSDVTSGRGNRILKMIQLIVSRKNKPSFKIYFKTVEDCKNFTDFEQELIANVKKKTLEEKENFETSRS